MRDDQRRGQHSWWYWLLPLATTAFVGYLPYMARRQNWRHSANWMLVEDGPYESMAATITLASTMLFGWAFLTIIRFPKKRLSDDQQADTGIGKVTRKWRGGAIGLTGVWTIISLLMLGEETNWGQHVLHFQVPQWIAKHSSTGEFNLHNLEIVVASSFGESPLQVWWLKTMLVWLIAIPVLLSFLPKLRLALLEAGLIFPSVPIALAMALAATQTLFSTQELSDLAEWSGQLSSEILELNIELMIFFYACEVVRSVSLARNRSIRPSTLLILGAAPAALALVLIITLPSPAEENEQRAISGMALFLANRYRDEGNLSKAIEHYRIAIDAVPENHFALRALGEIHMDEDRIDEAVECYVNLVGILGTDPEAHRLLGTALVQADEFPSAEQCFRNSIFLSPEEAQSHLSLAMLLIQTNRVVEARRSLITYLRLRPEDTEASELLHQISLPKY